jgi:hypothetical protein
MRLQFRVGSFLQRASPLKQVSGRGMKHFRASLVALRKIRCGTCVLIDEAQFGAFHVAE